MNMTKNTKTALIAVGIGAVVYFLWKRSKDSNNEKNIFIPKPSDATASASEPIMTTRPMIIGEVS